MKLNSNRWLSLVCALLPLAALGEELPIKPVWEIQARLDGTTSPVFSRKIEALISKGGVVRASSGPTTLRIAGFTNDKTPEKDWIAEIRGIQGIGEILTAMESGPECAAWSGGLEALMLAGPARNKGQVIKEMVALVDDVWLSGWVDFGKLEEAGGESKLLSLPQNLKFAVTGNGDIVTVTLRPLFDSPATAKAVSEWLAELQTLLRKVNVSSLNPPIISEVDGATVIVKMDFKEQDIERLCDKIKGIIAEESEEIPSDSDH